MSKERQGITDAASDVIFERCGYVDRDLYKQEYSPLGLIVVTVAEWDEREAEIARLTAGWAKAGELAGYWMNKYFESKPKEVMPNGETQCHDRRSSQDAVTGGASDKHAALTYLPPMDARLGRGNG